MNGTCHRVLQGRPRHWDVWFFTIRWPGPETARRTLRTGFGGAGAGEAGDAAVLSQCGAGGTTWTDTALEQGMSDDEWRVAAGGRLRLWADNGGMCVCGMMRDERGGHT